jgi:hypothetical protein
MTEEQSPVEQAVEQALDLLFYAPVGLALTVRDELPKLVEKGRRQVSGQLALAKMAGQFALGQAQREVERMVGQATERLHEIQARGSPVPETAPAERPSPNGSEGAAPVIPAPNPGPPPAAPAVPPAAGVQYAPGDGAGRRTLAIPGYDLLSASQVVQRLAGLSPHELEEVRAHEASHRGRKTILARIHQIQTDA